MQTTTILLAEDHRLVRESWAAILNCDPRFQIVAESENGEEAVQQAKELKPDIILMDINMQPLNGFEATKQIKRHSPHSKVIGLSMHSDPSYAKKMILNGASGYLTKNTGFQEIISAIEEVSLGNIYICQEIKKVLSEQELFPSENKPRLEDLTPKETEIIKFIKQGFSSKEISSELQIAPKTVEVHRYNILRKLGLTNTAALVNLVNTSGFS